MAFEKYAKAGQSLFKPSSAARAIGAGAQNIERVDKLVQKIGAQHRMQLDAIDDIVKLVGIRLGQNRTKQAM